MSIRRRVGRVILAALALGALALALVYLETWRRMARRVTLPPRDPVTVVHTDSAIARGTHLATSSLGCTGCHGADVGGRVIVDEPMVMRLVAPNITSGPGGVLAAYDDAALERAIRHGVGADRRPLVIMPSHEFAFMGHIALGPVARVLGLAGKLTLFPYDHIDHTVRPVATAPLGVSVERGRYLAVGCIGCHRGDLRGGPIVGGPPDWPPAPDITASGTPGTWSEDDFVRTIRTGRRPDGTVLRAPMPWPDMARMHDEELRSLHRYLVTLGVRAVPTRAATAEPRWRVERGAAPSTVSGPPMPGS
ncbi:MAG: hypothetical protein MUF21_08375 [Gemmatimonadaceae bacterium]|nr:hypothetical protein [Gemmatimonadaceae bacterium]